MSIEKVRNYLKHYNKENEILEFDVSSATVELASKALNTEPAKIAKTLALKDKDNCIVIVTAGDGKIDNQKFKSEFGFKAKMLSHDETFFFTGHEVGGVCPFALPNSIKCFIDVSLKRFETVFPACGSSNSAIELTPDELFEISKSEKWVNICKDWQ